MKTRDSFVIHTLHFFKETILTKLRCLIAIFIYLSSFKSKSNYLSFKFNFIIKKIPKYLSFSLGGSLTHQKACNLPSPPALRNLAIPYIPLCFLTVSPLCFRRGCAAHSLQYPASECVAFWGTLCEHVASSPSRTSRTTGCTASGTPCWKEQSFLLVLHAFQKEKISQTILKRPFLLTSCVPFCHAFFWFSCLWVSCK